MWKKLRGVAVLYGMVRHGLRAVFTTCGSVRFVGLVGLRRIGRASRGSLLATMSQVGIT